MSKIKKSGIKQQCWLCRGWQDTAYMVKENFGGLEEYICLSCKSMLNAREDSLEQSLIEQEDMQQFESGELIQYGEAEGPDKALHEEAEKRKHKREEGDSDDEPAKETYLP